MTFSSSIKSIILSPLSHFTLVLVARGETIEDFTIVLIVIFNVKNLVFPVCKEAIIDKASYSRVLDISLNIALYDLCHCHLRLMSHSISFPFFILSFSVLT